LYVDKISNALKKKGSSFEIVNSCFELCRLETSELSIRKGSELVKRAVIKNVKQGEEWYDLYRKVLLFRAPYCFEDYLIYLEIDRPPEERFYQPRRKVLKVVVEELQALADDELDELFVSMPPRVGKTTILMLFITWIMGRDGEASNLYSAFSAIITSAMYTGVLEVVTDSYTYNWKKVFNNSGIANTDAKKETIDIDRKKRYPTLTCRSLYGTLNGACDCSGYLISDDLIGGIEEALNKDRLMNAWSKVTNNLIPRTKQFAKKIWIGTRWSLIDPAGLRMDFLQNNEEGKKVRFKIINLPALNENDESNFNYDYNVGFNTDYYKQLRAQFERNNDMASWQAQYMGEPIERDGALFTPDTMNFYNGVIADEPVRNYMTVDVAWGGGDYVSAPVCVETENGDFIPDVVFNNGDKTITRPLIVDCIIKNNVKYVQFEANNGGSEYAEWIERELKQRGYKCTITSKSAPTNKRKEARIFERAPEIREFYYLDNGRRHKEYQLFMNNLYAFKIVGKNKNDDAPDSMAMLSEVRERGKYTSVTTFSRKDLGI
jgi:predicted phage terminase large subunit-like protein